MLNQQFGNYKFLSVLGEGGMAIVYLAENSMLAIAQNEVLIFNNK